MERAGKRHVDKSGAQCAPGPVVVPVPVVEIDTQVRERALLLDIVRALARDAARQDHARQDHAGGGQSV